MIKNLIKLADKLEKQDNKALADRIDQILIAIAQEIEGQISAKDLVKVQPDDQRKHHMLRALVDLVDFDIAVERDKEGKGNFVRVIPKIQDGKTDGLNLGDLSGMPGIEQFLNKKEVEQFPQEKMDDPEHSDIDEALQGLIPAEESAAATKPEGQGIQMLGPDQFQYDRASFVGSLVKMADKLDQKGDHEAAEKIDVAIDKLCSKKIEISSDSKVGLGDSSTSQPLTVVEAARPKAPLKGLNDDVKKNLVLFIIDADKSMSKGVGGLKELFRRLRYFDVDDSVRDLGLDKVVKEMEKTQSCLDSAKKTFYTLVFGKNPSKVDLEELSKSLKGEEDTDDGGQMALDFFEQHADGPELVSNEDVVEDTEIETEAVESEDLADEELEDLLKDFWSEEEM